MPARSEPKPGLPPRASARATPGPLLGETEVIKPSTDSAAPPVQLHASLTPTAGVHDVYLVFRNEQSPSGQQMLFVVLTATFQAAPPGKSQ